MANTIAAGKAKRKDFALFYEYGTTPTYELIGKGIEETGIEQSANVETVTDITGVTETTLDKYEKTTELDPIRIEGGNKFSEFLDELEEQEKILDDTIANFMLVKLYKSTGTDAYVAWKQQAVVELTSFGGDTSGVNAPCTLHWIGPRTHGTFDPATKTFTASA